MPSLYRPTLLSRMLALVLCLSTLRALCDGTVAPAGSFNLEAVAAKATREGKSILIVFKGGWDKEGARLEESCLSSNHITSLIDKHLVRADIEVLGAPDLTSRFHVTDVPMMVLLRPDGTEIDRWLGYRSGANLARELSQALQGNTSLKRMRSEVVPSDPATRRRLCYTLVNRGSYDDALVELRRLYAQVEYDMPQNRRSQANVQLWIIRLLGAIRAAHPNSENFLLERLEEHTADAHEPGASGTPASRVAGINAALGRPDDTLEFFSSFPLGSKAHKELRSTVFGMYVERKRWEDAVALFPAEEIASKIDRLGRIPWGLVHAIVRVRFPLRAGELMRTAHVQLAGRWVRYFQPYAAVKDTAGARKIAEIILRHDQSEQAATLLTLATRRVLGEDGDAFLRSLNVKGLPVQDSRPDLVKEAASDDSDDEDSGEPVVKLSPYLVSTRSVGAIPLNLALPSLSSSKQVPSHLPLRTPTGVTAENLAPYRLGGWLVAIENRSIKGWKWDALREFWLEGAETGSPVKLVVKGIGQDDCIYREVTVKRMRRPVVENAPTVSGAKM